MRFGQSIHALVLLLVATWLIDPRLPVKAAQSPSTWGSAVYGLQMSLSLDSTVASSQGAPDVVLGLRNLGTDDIRVLLDVHCGEQPIGTSEITLTMSDSRGKPGPLKYYGPDSRLAGCGGAAEMTVVPLQPGASYYMPLNLDNYNPLGAVWAPGKYVLQASLTNNKVRYTLPSPHPEPYWMGTVTSNQLEVSFPTP